MKTLSIFILLLISTISHFSVQANEASTSLKKALLKLHPNEDIANVSITSFSEVSRESANQRLLWKFNLNSEDRLLSSPAIGTNNTIYFGSDTNYLLAFNHDGSVQWQFEADSRVIFSPAVANDGTIYISSLASYGGTEHFVYAINPDGSEKWRIQMQDPVFTAFALANDGTIYYGSYGGKLVAINPDGTVYWQVEVETDGNGDLRTPVIAKDGGIYANTSEFLLTVSPEGEEKWRFEFSTYFMGVPSIAEDGTVYLGSQDRQFYAVSSIGKLKWRVPIAGVNTNVTIDKDGTLYFGSIDSNLYALSPDGAIKWSFKTEGAIFSSPAIADDGNLYFGSTDHFVYALNRNGTEQWRFETDDHIITSPTIDNQGVIYIASQAGTVYALQSDSTGLASTPWPKFLHNKQNTSSAENHSVRKFNRFDYDGDGRADLAVRRSSNSTQYINNSEDNELQQIMFGRRSNDIAISGDFDGDGIADVGVRRPSTQFWYILNSSGKDLITENEDGITRIQFGLKEEDIPIPADFDGDGITDLAVRRPSNQFWYVRNSSGNDPVGNNSDGITRLKFGLQSSDIPVVADYDGDGKADFAVRRPNTQFWYIRNSSGEDALTGFADGISRRRFGTEINDIPVTADFDGDGKADIAVRRPSTQYWYILNSSGTDVYTESSDGITRKWFGKQESDIPVVADYDGDGRADLAVRRPSNKTWYILNSSGEDQLTGNHDGISRSQFGLDPADIPVAAPTQIILEMILQ